MKSFILRFLASCISCLAGFTVAVIAVPGPMGPALFRDVMGEVFSFQFYSVELIAGVAVMSGLLLLADWVGPKRIHIVWLALIAAFFGGYFYAMGVRDYFGDVDNGITLYLQSFPQGPITNAVGMVVFLIVWLFPAVLLAVIKLAGSPAFRARVAVRGSKG